MGGRGGAATLNMKSGRAKVCFRPSNMKSGRANVCFRPSNNCINIIMYSILSLNPNSSTIFK